MTIGDTISLDELERDPYPAYQRLRDEEPVSFVPAVGLWLVTRFDDVKHVAMHPETFTAATEPSTLNRTMGENMLGMEGPEQQWIRAITETPFRPRDVEERTQGMIPRLAGELIDSLVERGEADLFREYADPMSVRSLCFMLGLDEVPWQDILRWNEGLMPGLANFEGDPAKQAPADEAASALHAAIRTVLTVSSTSPTGPCSRGCCITTEDGRRMSREQIVGNTTLMLSGGLQEPRDVIALTLWALLTESLRSSRRSAPTARWSRRPSRRRSVGPARWGQPHARRPRPSSSPAYELERGALIAAVLSSANRDPRRWADPDRFDVHRKEGAHLAFSAGTHFCLGAWFGRHLARVTLDLVLDRLPALELDAARPVTLSGWEFRAPDSLWARWRTAMSR